MAFTRRKTGYFNVSLNRKTGKSCNLQTINTWTTKHLQKQPKKEMQCSEIFFSAYTSLKEKQPKQKISYCDVISLIWGFWARGKINHIFTRINGMLYEAQLQCHSGHFIQVYVYSFFTKNIYRNQLKILKFSVTLQHTLCYYFDLYIYMYICYFSRN